MAGTRPVKTRKHKAMLAIRLDAELQRLIDAFVDANGFVDNYSAAGRMLLRIGLGNVEKLDYEWRRAVTREVSTIVISRFKIAFNELIQEYEDRNRGP